MRRDTGVSPAGGRWNVGPSPRNVAREFNITNNPTAPGAPDRSHSPPALTPRENATNRRDSIPPSHLQRQRRPKPGLAWARIYLVFSSLLFEYRPRPALPFDGNIDSYQLAWIYSWGLFGIVVAVAAVPLDVARDGDALAREVLLGRLGCSQSSGWGWGLG